MWARHSSLLSLAAAVCATGAMVVASSCSSGGNGFGGDDGGPDDAISAGGGCTALAACCPTLPTASVSGCDTIVTAGEAATCSQEVGLLQESGYCGGSATTTTTGTTIGGITTTTTGTTIGGITTTSGTTTGTTIGGITTTSGTTTGTTIGGSTTATTTTGTATTSGTTGTTTATCSAPSAGGIALTSNYLPSGTIGMGGYAYAFSDSMTVSGPSTACIDATSFCGQGSSGPTNTAAVGTVAAYGYYGGGIGVNLNQAMGANTAIDAFTPTGSGIAYAITGTPPAGLRLIIGNLSGSTGTDYCFPITAASGTVPWASFNSKCYDATPDGVAFAPADGPLHVNFQVSAGSSVTSWSFCVTSLSFM